MHWVNPLIEMQAGAESPRTVPPVLQLAASIIGFSLAARMVERELYFMAAILRINASADMASFIVQDHIHLRFAMLRAEYGLPRS